MEASEMGIIYALADPLSGEIRYIGKTIRSIEIRLRHHMKPTARKHKNRLSAWLTGLIRDGLRPIAIAVEQVAVLALNDAEIRWIAYHKAAGCDLVNGTAGGTGGATSIGRTISKAQVAKMMAGLRRAREEGRVAPMIHTPESRRKLSEARMGMKFTLDHRQNISKGKTGVKLMKARKLTPEQEAEAYLLATQGMPERAIAKIYGVAQVVVQRIKREGAEIVIQAEKSKKGKAKKKKNV